MDTKSSSSPCPAPVSHSSASTVKLGDAAPVTKEESSLLAACRHGRIGWLQGLLADDDQRLTSKDFLCGDCGGAGETPLFVAAENGHTKVVELLLSMAEQQPEAQRCNTILAMLNPLREDGSTPLLVATWKGHLDVVKQLTDALLKILATLEPEQRAQAVMLTLNVDDDSGANPIFAALCNGHEGIVSQLTTTLRQAMDCIPPEDDPESVIRRC